MSDLINITDKGGGLVVSNRKLLEILRHTYYR